MGGYSEHRKSISRLTATGGITVLLSIFCLYLTNLLPTGRIFWFLVSTVFLSFMVIEFGSKAALITYLASSLLGLILIPNKLILIPYILYFGYYGIIKHLVERKNKMIMEWIIKLVSFNAALLVFYLLITRLVTLNFSIELPIYLVILIAEIVFVIYDYCYSIAISYYNRVLSKKIRR